MLIKHRPSHLN
jgi:hypothetical protein